MKILFMVVAAMALMTGLGQAGTFPGSTTREPIARGEVSDRLSIGLGYDRIKRDISFSGGGGKGTLQADSISGYVGYNVMRGVTTFITAGATSLRGAEWTSRDYAMRLSAGVNAYFWEGDVLTPRFMAGRISINGSAEVLRHEADTNAGTTDWIEFIAALPIGYELFDRYSTTKSGVSTSLALYAGPAISFIDGSMALPGGSQSFKQDQVIGAVAGADIYFAPQLSLGAKALIFDDISTGASLRFHF